MGLNKICYGTPTSTTSFWGTAEFAADILNGKLYFRDMSTLDPDGVGWQTLGGGGGGIPGGANTQVQFNSSGVFGGSTALTFVSPTLTVGVPNTTSGVLAIANNTSATSGTLSAIGNVLNITGPADITLNVGTNRFINMVGAAKGFAFTPDTSLIAFGSASDAGISRLAAGSLAIGNGTAGDFTGGLKLTKIADSTGATGLSGQVLQSNGAAGVAWGGNALPTGKYFWGAANSGTGAGAATFSQAGLIDSSGGQTSGTLAQVFPTATQGWGVKVTVSAASGNNSGFVFQNFSTSNTTSPIMGWIRNTTVFQLNNTAASCRYWIGQGCFASGSTLGANGTAILGSTAYSTDTPNKTTIGFRFSTGTDTHWQACLIVANTSSPLTSTFVDTGITPDTNIHTFDVILNPAQTSLLYYIDGVLVATISSGLPVVAANTNSTLGLFTSCDNKNTASTASLTFYWAGVLYRG